MVVELVKLARPPSFALHDELAAVLFAQCIDTRSIAAQLRFSVETQREPKVDLLLAAFSAAHDRELDMHELFHDIENQRIFC